MEVEKLFQTILLGDHFCLKNNKVSALLSDGFEPGFPASRTSAFNVKKKIYSWKDQGTILVPHAHLSVPEASHKEKPLCCMIICFALVPTG
jgi:hypothetical protein